MADSSLFPLIQGSVPTMPNGLREDGLQILAGHKPLECHDENNL